MDAYEATRVVFSRIQSLDPENAAKIMGLLLIQDHGEKEMIRLAFGPEALLHSVILKARKDLGLLPPSTPASPSPAASPSPFFLPRQTSSRLLAGVGVPPPLTVTSPSWAPPPPFSRTNNAALSAADDLRSSTDGLISPNSPAPSPFYGGGGDLIDELQLQDQLSFLNDHAGAGGPKPGDLFYPDECRSPSGNGEGMFSPYGMGWGVNGHHRRSCSINDLCLGSDPCSPAGFGWRPCHYFARGYCKNGSSCRFLHGLPDDTAAVKMDAAVEQQCHELLFRSKSQRLMASAAAYPYSPTSTMPSSPSFSSKCINFLLQQQNDNQRAAAAAAALMMGEDTHKFVSRSRMERSDFSGMLNPGSRQIYLTFPADSTFREEDVSNYFSIYGPVQDVRIPYQPKRMFGFVTFVYPETVKLILAKGNPHFVCDSRVLVKPYKEKGKVPDKYRKQQQQAERMDFSGCNTPTGLDMRDPFDLQQIGSRMMYGSSSNQDVLLRRKLEEQQQAAELQQAIELQGRRFMGLHLLDLKTRSLPSGPSVNFGAPALHAASDISITPSEGTSSGGGSLGESPPSDKSPSPASGAAIAAAAAAEHEFLQQAAVNHADKEESASEASPNVDSDFQECADHNLPDSPFASPTKASFAAAAAFTTGEPAASPSSNSIANHLLTSSPQLDMASFKSCFFPMTRFSSSSSSSGHGAVEM